ncbi:hypothetical protein DFA_11056 [Cavenderia fasciculata]|uniref:DUF4326 domain-containing protein n=1 Tax=Cavenderia fasciculata TaxID=261658 RepID=F4QEN4_CACFS|nr:uncharacterized protein DFA_11056 [Cavenderia fasciculata]EGG13295.1 hypothetical protein DFA_11056 [Cavenderia fasciculata]|eukprot:XP_004349994.1 hypothetical protein DFA_11056 [Cavenderia fasciculata]
MQNNKPSTFKYSKDSSSSSGSGGHKPTYYKKKPTTSSAHSESSPWDSSPIDANGYLLYNQDFTHFVVHCLKKKNSYDVYVGRKNPLIESTVSIKWGNPFKVGKDGNRNECMKQYRDWIFHKDQNDLFLQAKRELKGKILACWCSPLNCHAMVLAEIANSSVSNQGYDPTQKASSSSLAPTTTTTTTTTTTSAIAPVGVTQPTTMEKDFPPSLTSTSSTSSTSVATTTTKPSSSSVSWANQVSHSSAPPPPTIKQQQPTAGFNKPKAPPSLDSELDFPSLWNNNNTKMSKKK